jgi:hypothetical protein
LKWEICDPFLKRNVVMQMQLVLDFASKRFRASRKEGRCHNCAGRCALGLNYTVQGPGDLHAHLVGGHVTLALDQVQELAETILPGGVYVEPAVPTCWGQGNIVALPAKYLGDNLLEFPWSKLPRKFWFAFEKLKDFSVGL